MSAPSSKPDLLDLLVDTEGESREELEHELEGHSVDIAAALTRLRQSAAALSATQRRTKLATARSARLKASPPSERLRRIRDSKLPLAELHSRIARAGGQVGHRDYSGWTREDLESELADIEELSSMGGTD